MNIVFVGFRGTGKTEVAKNIAKKFDKIALSTDSMIEQASQMSIQDIVKKFGWYKFRQLESTLIKDVSKLDDSIIDIGTGFVDSDENVKIVKDNNIIIWLDADTKIIKKRIANDTTKPPMIGKNITEEVDQLYKKRAAKYKKIASIRIDTSNLSVEKITQQVIDYLNT